MQERIARASCFFNLFATVTLGFVCYIAPVYADALAYRQMIVIHAEALPKDVTKFVQAEYDLKHHPRPKRKPQYGKKVKS